MCIRPSQSRGPHPPELRLLRYAVGAQGSLLLGITLLDGQRYTREDFAAKYGSRWQIEEWHKIPKQLLKIEFFQAARDTTVQQEVYAHCTLIALSRLFGSGRWSWSWSRCCWTAGRSGRR